MDTGGLFDEIRGGMDGRDEGMDRSYSASPDDWKPAAHAAVARVALERHRLTSEHVWDRLEHPPEPRALGAVMRAAAKAGFVRATKEFEPSRRASRHRAPVRVWESLICKAE